MRGLQGEYCSMNVSLMGFSQSDWFSSIHAFRLIRRISNTAYALHFGILFSTYRLSLFPLLVIFIDLGWACWRMP